MRPYCRKLSTEDAATGSILIVKSRWRDFPPPMKEFMALVKGEQFATRIIAEECACVPPPHEHYHLEAAHFAARLKFSRGETIEITRDGDGPYGIANG